MASGSVKLHGDIGNVNAVEVSFCVERRPDVCGPARNATIGQYSQLSSLLIHWLLDSFVKIALVQCD